MMNNFAVDMPTQVVFGPGKLQELPKILADRFGAKRVLIVTDQGLVQSAAYDQLIQVLKDHQLAWEVYGQVAPNPTSAMVDDASQLQKDAGAEVVIGFGGGSCIDVAKGVADLGTNPGRISDYFGVEKFKEAPMPLVAIPTTAGTGSEVSMAAVFGDHGNHMKNAIHSRKLRPQVAVLDPLLLAGLPQRVAIESGMDALCHLIEGYVSKGANTFSDMLALEGIRRAGRYLLPFVADRSNVEAAGNMLYAAMLGGLVLTFARTGAAHTLTRPLGSRLSHGLANAIVLPYVMEFNMMAAVEKFCHVAKALGETVDGINLANAYKAAEAVKRFNREFGIPEGLSAVGVTAEEIPELAKAAYDLDLSKQNPRELRVPDLERLFHQCL